MNLAAVPARRTGARREPNWEALDLSTLSLEERTLLGKTWRSRAKSEHLAVSAFCILSTEAAREGAPRELLSILTKAANDEVRHAELCDVYAARLLGDALTQFSGEIKPPRYEGVSGREEQLLHVVGMCCLNETMTGVYLTEMVSCVDDPTVRDLLESLLEDEIDHGRVGWAFAARAVEQGWGRRVLQHWLPTLKEQSLAPVRRNKSEADLAMAPKLSKYGYISASDGIALYERTWAEVIAPGFAQLGVVV